ncbi:polyprenyl synthetase family protein [Actinomadura sp. DC4]|uniref:polyprenyl synthetase family protein n=1 Tax=Actinomadura sp. DC4 TaxID=3055069 RepID=UPI0025B1E95D|nr:polyprenyl synthetase family protein [Actinomadura sp. DC4]MDN3354421.1 polyprenyl synthetase family protein [Actinomadura sp. DC4]
MVQPDAAEILIRTRDAVDPELRKAVHHLPESLRTIAGYHLGWWDEHATPTDAGAGKAVRATLTLLAAEAVGGTAEQGMPAAVAVELVHNASLLHDDVIDDDRTRRHRPAVWSVFGVPAAILAGDALFFLAIRILGEAPAPLSTVGVNRLNDAVQQLLDGEYADTAFAVRDEVTVAECQAMASAKTGALIVCACTLGALAGGAGPAQLEALRAFGHHLGIAFQIIDDLTGIWGDPARTGKPHLSDLRTRKKSFPVAAALRGDSAAARELAGLYRHRDELGEAELHRAADLVEAAGGRGWAGRQAAYHLDAALDRMHGPAFRAEAATKLAALVDLLTSQYPLAPSGAHPRTQEER